MEPEPQHDQEPAPKEFFEITSVSRVDLMQVFPAVPPEEIDRLPNEEMEKLARQMGEAYITNRFWGDLEIFGEMILKAQGLEPGEPHRPT